MAPHAVETIDQHSRLLDLLIELLDRTIALLQPEALLPLRLACKTLESATFESFVKAFVNKRVYYMLPKASWTQLRKSLRSFPRLVDNIKVFEFTKSALLSCWANAMQSVPNKEQKNIVTAQWSAWNAAQINGFNAAIEDGRRPYVTLMTYALLEIAALAPKAEIKLNLRFYLRMDLNAYILEYDSIVAISRANVDLHDIVVDFESLPFLELLIGGGQAAWSYFCVCELQTLQFMDWRSLKCGAAFRDDLMGFLEKLIRNAETLRTSDLDLTAECRKTPESETSLAKQLISAAYPTWITTFRLSEARVAPKTLLLAWKHWEPSLQNVTLRGVELAAPCAAWSTVLETLLEMVELRCLTLFDLFAREPRGLVMVMFDDVEEKYRALSLLPPMKPQYGLMFDGKGAVVSGLRNMSSAKQQFTPFPAEDEDA